MKFVNAGYMATDPRNRQEVFSDGDHISGNSLEPGGWSLENDNGAYKPGRDWTHKSFFLNTVYESAHLHQMMKKCHEDFDSEGSRDDFLLGNCAPHAQLRLVEDVCEGVGEDCRLPTGLLDLLSQPELTVPLTPTSLLPSTTPSTRRLTLTSSASELGTAMRITSSSPWCSCNQPAATSCSQQRPAATSQSQTVTLFGQL